VTVGIFTFELHLRDTRSLKGKRQVVKRLKDRLRARFNVAVSELNDHDGLWQRAALAVVSVADQRDTLDRLFESIRAEAELLVPGHVVVSGMEFLEAADGGPSGWSEEWE
jgi:uncharacterized protein YlxP (DUF503 family)